MSAKRELNTLADRLNAAVRRALVRTQREALRVAVRWSSGRISPRVLRRERPYARRHGRPKRDPGRVNVGKTKTFSRSWEKGEIEARDGALEASIWNADPKAVFLEAGTRTMFARPVAERIMLELESRRVLEQEMERELDRIFG